MNNLITFKEVAKEMQKPYRFKKEQIKNLYERIAFLCSYFNVGFETCCQCKTVVGIREELKLDSHGYCIKCQKKLDKKIKKMKIVINK